MWNYYLEKEKVTLEVLSLHIKDNQTFEAELLGSSFSNSEVILEYDREITSLEEEEVSGYVTQHLSAEIVSKGKYIKRKHLPSGKIECEEHYLTKDTDGNYITLISKKEYKYASSEELLGFTLERFDKLGQPYERTNYRIYSDPVTRELIIEEDSV